MGKEISDAELQERIKILQRLKKLLQQQRQKFQDYLTVLEKQETVIAKEDTEALMQHTELEQQIVENITNLQKVIVPIESMYSDNAESMAFVKDFQNEASEIPVLKTDLAKLQQQVLAQNRKNCDLLKSHMKDLRTQMNGFNNPYKFQKSVYATAEHTASMISIEG